VFLPLLFMGGLSGQLFREFGVTIAGAVILSAVVALTLTPMMSSRMLSNANGRGRFYVLTERWFVRLERNYELALTHILKRPAASLGALVLSGALIVLLLATLPRELAPLEDRDRIMIRTTAPESVGYEYMRDFMSELAQATAGRVPEARMLLMQVPGVSGGVGVQGAINTGYIRVFLSEGKDRQRSQSQIAEDLRALQAQFPAARINITQEPTIGERRANQSGLQFVIQAPDVESLREILPDILQRARASPVFSFVDSDLKFDKQEVRLEIDRDKARALGVSARDIAQTLQTAFAGQRFGYFINGGKQYEVLAQFTRDFRSSPQNLGAIGLRGDSDERLTPLDNLVTLSEATAPAELYRHNRYVSATLTATLAQGRTMGEGIAALQALATDTLDERFHTTLTGAASEFVDSASSLAMVVFVALLLVYLALSAQFESFLDPLVILLTVPLAMAGALSALWCFGQSLNVFSQIGLIMLIGLVTKNGILIVEFANQRLLAGAADVTSAVQEAACLRMRPIMMTTFATAFGLLPIALALGAGAESRKCMGIAVIGGLLFGSVLTLGVIPAMYSLLKRPIAIADPEALALPAVSAGR
jgi:multidrug efflux pump